MYPATSVAITDATKDETFVAPTALTEKLYGGAENICDSVIEIKTSHDMQIVNRSVAHITIGDRMSTKGRRRVLQKDTRSQ